MAERRFPSYYSPSQGVPSSSSGEGGGLGGGAIAGIVIGSIVGAAVIFGGGGYLIVSQTQRYHARQNLALVLTGMCIRRDTSIELKFDTHKPLKLRICYTPSRVYSTTAGEWDITIPVGTFIGGKEATAGSICHKIKAAYTRAKIDAVSVQVTEEDNGGNPWSNVYKITYDHKKDYDAVFREHPGDPKQQGSDSDSDSDNE